MENINLEIDLKCTKEKLYTYLTDPTYLNLWIGDSLIKQPYGFDIYIKLELHTIKIIFRVIEMKKYDEVLFQVKSEYISDFSLLTFQITESETNSHLLLTEKCDYSLSRWKKAKEIHFDIWKNALNRLKETLKET